MGQAAVQNDTARIRAALIAGFLVYLAVVCAAWWEALRLVPAHVAITLLNHTVDTDHAHEHINNAAMVVLLLPSALWIECLATGWRNSSARQLLLARTPSLDTDLACFVLGQAYVLDIVGRVLLLGASMISGAAIHGWLETRTGLAIGPPPIPLAAQVILYFFVYTFFDYWTHRLDHTPRFWPLHRYHHSATDFAVVTSVRQHPVALTPIFVINLPLAILGAPAPVMIYVNVLVVGIGFLIHSKIDSDWGWVGRWLIQSPNHHRAHHKLDMSYPTGNFAIAPIWDRLFGTWSKSAAPSTPIGVDTPYRHGPFVARDMLRDYAHFWLGWLGLKTDGPQADLKLFDRRKAS